MYVAITLVLVIASMIAHELGRFFAMRSCGITVREIAIGLPLSYVPKIRMRFRRILGRTSVVCYPVILGAYVLPTKRGQVRLASSSYRDAAYVYGMGPWASFAFGILLFFVSLVINECPFEYFVKTMVLATGVLGLFWLLRRIFCLIVIPLASVPLMMAMGYLVAQKPSESLMGPIGIGQTIAQHATSLDTAIFLAAVISISVGLMNILPLVPLDGGGIVEAWLRTHGVSMTWRSAYMMISLLFLMVFIGTIFTDVTKFFR